MEIEAWFLAEASHFPRIDSAITVPEIISKLGFDPSVDDMRQRAWPAEDMRACYAIGGKLYEKGRAENTVNALAYDRIYLETRSKFGHLDRLLTSLESFLEI
ncbi:hypothetical protein FRUB_01695 [Fimbriiglobus ruber]|uniref:Uncharacterized protein n=2 Tax=Fimbriiglobus ruber TaxID=1908690 RepID=A0A225E0N5_9BACT|nr:hypothetical protein FRUB_01695 [Fimbriiglobus ruber]